MNTWVKRLAFYGLFGLIPFMLLTFFAFLRLGQVILMTPSPRAHWAAWMVLASFVGWQVAFITVTPLAQLITFVYVAYGLISNLPAIALHWQQEEVEALENAWESPEQAISEGAYA